MAKVLIEKLANINTFLDEKAGIADRRIEGTDASVRSRVIAALMSEAQRTEVEKNAQVAAAPPLQKIVTLFRPIRSVRVYNGLSWYFSETSLVSSGRVNGVVFLCLFLLCGLVLIFPGL
ncbi:hypothetical protein [Acetobacter cerevisiae]|uniref:hypothetical protein n=1 Tax=Acetobacter cerevisiae TaxID=178900 RepID=UPI002231978B|nr:hypothetical protein [Acetobacter cerevisiae]